jgi:hypothetical protein
LPSYDLFVTRAAGVAGNITKSSVTASGTQYSAKVPVRNGAGGWTLETSGTVAGTPTLWYSDHERPNEANDTDWVQDTGWAPTVPAGAATKVKYSFEGQKTRWFRIKFVTSGGSGELFGRAVV